MARIGARLLLQTVLEAEITEFLGRNRYERRAAATDARAGSRNGHSSLTVKTTAGPVVLQAPEAARHSRAVHVAPARHGA